MRTGKHWTRVHTRHPGRRFGNGSDGFKLNFFFVLFFFLSPYNVQSSTLWLAKNERVFPEWKCVVNFPVNRVPREWMGFPRIQPAADKTSERVFLAERRAPLRRRIPPPWSIPYPPSLSDPRRNDPITPRCRRNFMTTREVFLSLSFPLSSFFSLYLPIYHILYTQAYKYIYINIYSDVYVFSARRGSKRKREWKYKCDIKTLSEIQYV